MRIRSILALTLLVLCVQGLEALAQQAKFVIRVRGADSMAGRIDQLAGIFMKTNPDVNILVSGGSNETTGLPELMDKHAEIAMAGCQASREEFAEAKGKGVTLVERLVGYGGIVIIAHPSNSLNDLTLEQVRKIFLGESKAWEDLGGTKGPVTVVSVGNAHAGSVRYMETEVLGGRPIVENAIRVKRFQACLRMVAKTPGSVGFVRIRDALESGLGVEIKFKVLKIKKDAGSPAVAPSRLAIADASYPLKRPFYIYHESNASAEVKKFVDFVVSKGWGPQ